MARRSAGEPDPLRWMLEGAAPEPATWDEPAAEPQAGNDHPDLEPPLLRGRDARGNVRPADDRYLTDEQILERDVYLEEVAAANPAEPTPQPLEADQPEQLEADQVAGTADQLDQLIPTTPQV